MPVCDICEWENIFFKWNGKTLYNLKLRESQHACQHVVDYDVAHIICFFCFFHSSLHDVDCYHSQDVTWPWLFKKFYIGRVDIYILWNYF